MKRVWQWVTVLVLLISMVGLMEMAHPLSAWGAPATSASSLPARQTPLTVAVLQDRLKSPTRSEGVRVIDLRRLEIDLRPENEAFRDQFYHLIHDQLQTQPLLGLDFSYSHIIGELRISDLGVKSPAYGQIEVSTPLSDAVKEQLNRDRRRLSQFSQLSRSLLIQAETIPAQLTLFQGPLLLVQTELDGVANFANTYFLNRLEAQGAVFAQKVDCSESRFSESANFSGSIFSQTARFRGSIFFQRARFNQVQFYGSVNFQSNVFYETANFSQSGFVQGASFNRVQWDGNADFGQTYWQDIASFERSRFLQSVFFTEATFEKLLTFRQAEFNQPVNLRGASILDQADLGDTRFAKTAYFNVSGLQFNAEKAQIVGDPGQVGRVLSVPTLQGNETLLRNLVRNFRLQEQIPDANQIEYVVQTLRLKQLQRQLSGTNLNTASVDALKQVGFSNAQAIAITHHRTERPFGSLTDLLKLDEIDLATYVKVRDRIVAGEPRSILNGLGDALHWLGLLLLLSMSRNGSSFWLIFGVGMVTLAYFALLFWIVDRVRRLHPQPILPRLDETGWMLGGSGVLMIVGVWAIFRTAEHPAITLGCIGLVTLPLPVVLTVLIYQRGRYHDQMDVSYFVEDGSMRQLRLLIGRLPNIPKFVFFRDRYTPIPWERRWNWLNYLDFSLNNLLKFGFNDIRLRDQHIPGLITTLAWYQWTLGLLYFAILLWTLSRTIPGLNLLIYFK